MLQLRARARLSVDLASVGRFEPATESLVSNDAVFFAQNYDIDVVYEYPSGPDPRGTVGYRLIEGPLCKRLRETRLPRGAHVHVAVWTYNPRERWSKDAPTLCVVGTPEDPPLRPFVVQQDRPGWPDWSIKEEASSDSTSSRRSNFHQVRRAPVVASAALRGLRAR